LNQKIVDELMSIEADNGVRVLYACESGSRAWGFPSVDSDYDIRFIYIHPTEWYLSVFDKPDYLEKMEGLLDFSGWDLRKALRLFRKSNPALMEWLQSPVIYKEATSFTTIMKEKMSMVFSSRSSLYHYLNMARGNLREYLQGELVKVKKYFYVLRPVLACMWIERFNTVPPMEFECLLNNLLPEGNLKSEIRTLLIRKRAGEELAFEPKIKIINEFINHELEYFQSLLVRKQTTSIVDEETFDIIFRQSLKEIWG
jgi:predicted nucleotidyltransferase